MFRCLLHAYYLDFVAFPAVMILRMTRTQPAAVQFPVMWNTPHPSIPYQTCLPMSMSLPFYQIFLFLSELSPKNSWIHSMYVLIPLRFSPMCALDACVDIYMPCFWSSAHAFVLLWEQWPAQCVCTRCLDTTLCWFCHRKPNDSVCVRVRALDCSVCVCVCG